MFYDIATMGSQFIGSDPCNFVYSNLQIKGTMVGCMRDTDRALEFAERVCEDKLSLFYRTKPSLLTIDKF